MPLPKLTDWNKGDSVLSRAHHQEPVDALRRLYDVLNAGVGTVPKAEERIQFPVLFGVVVSEGPNGESDFTDERSWVQIQYVAAASTDQERLTFNDRFRPPENPDGAFETGVKQIVVAKSFPNRDGGVKLHYGTRVQLQPVWDADANPILHYLILNDVNGFWLEITGHTRLGSNWKWEYDWRQTELLDGGGNWGAVSGGVTSADFFRGALNTTEIPNGTSGMSGSGVNLDNLPAGFTLQPAPNGSVRWGRLVRPRNGDNVQVWFEFENTPDGVCP